MPNSGTAIQYSFGTTHVTDSSGRHELAINHLGIATLNVSRTGRQVSWWADIGPDTLAAVWSHLESAGFPAITSAAAVPPGATVYTVHTFEPRPRQVTLSWHAKTQAPGYRDAFRMLDEVVAELPLRTRRLERREIEWEFLPGTNPERYRASVDGFTLLIEPESPTRPPNSIYLDGHVLGNLAGPWPSCWSRTAGRVAPAVDGRTWAEALSRSGGGPKLWRRGRAPYGDERTWPLPSGRLLFTKLTRMPASYDDVPDGSGGFVEEPLACYEADPDGSNVETYVGYERSKPVVYFLVGDELRRAAAVEGTPGPQFEVRTVLSGLTSP